MKPDTKIKYTFRNNIGETVEMVFTIMQVEGATGGFVNHVTDVLDELGFGLPVEINRIIL